MTNKIFSFVLFFVFALVVGSFSVKTAYAADVTFPAGCSSGLGTSITTGLPCNGTSTAVTMVPGCTNAIGYSTTTNQPCSGTTVAIQHLAGCLSTLGYSPVTQQPCNGTANPYLVTIGGPEAPGLPRTGSGGNAGMNAMLLGSSGLLAVLGLASVSRRSLQIQ